MREGEFQVTNFSSPWLRWGAKESGLSRVSDWMDSFESSDDHHLTDALKIDQGWDKEGGGRTDELSGEDVTGYRDYPGS